MLDGALSQAVLYQQVLDKVRARLVHLIVDACHAEAVVRPRDLEAKTVELLPQDLGSHLSKTARHAIPTSGWSSPAAATRRRTSGISINRAFSHTR